MALGNEYENLSQVMGNKGASDQKGKFAATVQDKPYQNLSQMIEKDNQRTIGASMVQSLNENEANESESETTNQTDPRMRSSSSSSDSGGSIKSDSLFKQPSKSLKQAPSPNNFTAELVSGTKKQKGSGPSGRPLLSFEQSKSQQKKYVLQPTQDAQPSLKPEEFEPASDHHMEKKVSKKNPPISSKRRLSEKQKKISIKAKADVKKLEAVEKPKSKAPKKIKVSRRLSKLGRIILIAAIVLLPIGLISFSFCLGYFIPHVMEYEWISKKE